MKIFKYNIYYIIGLAVGILLFYQFEVWRLYPTYGGDYLQDWKYIQKYSNCLLDDKLSYCEELLQFQFVYPKIWLQISILFKNNFEQVIYLFVLLYFTTSLYFFQNSKKIFHVFLVFSPNSILLLQRGNNEIIIYFLAFVFLILINNKKRVLSLLPLLTAIFLKLYPLVLAPIYLVQSKTNKKSGVFLFLIIFILAIFLADNIINTQGIIHSKILLTYSSGVILKLTKFLIDFTYINLFFYCFTFLFFSYCLSKLFKLQFNIPSHYKYENSFLVGSLILVSSFFLSSSFDYRYIFIIYTFPYMIIFLEKNFSKTNVNLIISIIFISLWIEFIIFYYYEFIDFSGIKAKLGYVFNLKTLLFAFLILIKNILYWIVNILISYISLRIVLKRI